MNVDNILTHFQKVRKFNNKTNAWVALCPAHPDKTPSLAIKMEGDKPLFHCFAGCTFEEILSAAGLSHEDLMGERPDHYQSHHPRLDPYKLLDAMAMDSLRVGLIASRMANGATLAEDEKEALVAISGAFQRAVESIKNRNGRKTPWTE